jgi:DNA-binding MarR family transcriptional regulator
MMKRRELRTSRPEAYLPYLIKRLEHRIRQVFERQLREAGIDASFAGLAVLTVLVSEEGRSGAELARRSLVTPQTMNTVLKRLEQARWIRHRANPDSGRADQWFITEAGRELLARAQQVLMPTVETMESALTREQRAAVRTSLDLLLARLDQLEAQARSGTSDDE